MSEVLLSREIMQLRDEIERLRAERDKLLAALKDTEAELPHLSTIKESWPRDCVSIAKEIIEAAIAKAEGK